VKDENDAYLLQCIRLGMLIADPAELDGMEESHFGDAVLRDVARELTERRKTANAGKKLKNGPTLLTTLLVELGCEEGIKSVEDAKSAIRDRVELIGRFVRASTFLGEMVKVTESRNLSNYELRRFAESVENGMNPRT
jgi:hypothetical protein